MKERVVELLVLFRWVCSCVDQRQSPAPIGFNLQVWGSLLCGPLAINCLTFAECGEIPLGVSCCSHMRRPRVLQDFPAARSYIIDRNLGTDTLMSEPVPQSPRESPCSPFDSPAFNTVDRCV